jgi:2,4-dienoyl-CoA reductase-like NADH-dependent reductase (Old Yellow Enzyme family)
VTKLFEPIQIRSLKIRNRVFIAPMCQYSCENKNGVPGDWHSVHYPGFASGGAGLVMVEASAVSPIGRISPWDTGIWNEEQATAWSGITESIHNRGAAAGIQLAHAGRKASVYREWSGSGSVPIQDGGWQSVSCTDEAFTGYTSPRKLETSEIFGIIDEFRLAAQRSVDADFDVVEIHAAHGYLVHQFLSPLTNQRTDQYGGSLENRARLLLESVSAIRGQLGEDYPIMVRFSATDYHPAGWAVEDTATVAAMCVEAGADFFDISSGGLVTGVSIPTGPGYQVDFAETIAKQSGVRVSAVGQITTGDQAEGILQQTDIEAVSIGRAALREQFWAASAANQLGVELDYWPAQYRRGWWPNNS